MSLGPSGEGHWLEWGSNHTRMRCLAIRLTAANKKAVQANYRCIKCLIRIIPAGSVPVELCLVVVCNNICWRNVALIDLIGVQHTHTRHLHLLVLERCERAGQWSAHL